MHLPTPAQTFSQSAAVLALPPAPAPASVVAPPVVALPPLVLLPPLALLPALLLPATLDLPPLLASNKSCAAGLPQANARAKAQTKPIRRPAVSPCRMRRRVYIEMALCCVRMREHQFDGLVGPTHHYAGLSPGNLASQQHAGEPSSPRAAALEGLAKMRHVRELGVAQAVLPPQPRPSVALLRRLGFFGSDQAVLESALRSAPELLHAASSASSMWAANAATVVPARDALDGKTHFVPANLVTLLHRSIEAESTQRVLAAIFGDVTRFTVHAPLPASEALSDEGAANHTRLAGERGVAHLFGWGRRKGDAAAPRQFPARQAHAASAALARVCQLPEERALLWQQHPLGIDAGAFHTDVLAVGTADVLLLHELAFVDSQGLLSELRARLGESFQAVVASEQELPLADAVAAYPFNSQLLQLPAGKLRIVAPRESRDNAAARRFLERAVSESEQIDSVDYLDVNGSMRNGGGPACLRLRVPLEPAESASLGASVLFDEALEERLRQIIGKRYRDRLELKDMADPQLVDEAYTALDEITDALALGSIYDFQR
jgi:succinylarginine dihydrolase